MMQSTVALTCVILLRFASASSTADAQGGPGTSSTPAPTQVLVLVPYEEPETKDPHAAGVTQSLSLNLQQQGIPVKSIAPIDHLSAVASAAQLCRDNGAGGLLIAEGR